MSIMHTHTEYLKKGSVFLAQQTLRRDKTMCDASEMVTKLQKYVQNVCGEN